MPFLFVQIMLHTPKITLQQLLFMFHENVTSLYLSAFHDDVTKDENKWKNMHFYVFFLHFFQKR